MSILIFIIILVVLVIGHEFGHFIAAKKSGMRVLEFGFGFPPRLWKKKVGETDYSVNALPFGGFVKIFGEERSDASSDTQAFSNKSPLTQAGVLAAGPFANLLIAFVLSSVAFMAGVPYAFEKSDDAAGAENLRVLVAETIPESPAAHAGIEAGDHILSLSVAGSETTVSEPSDIAEAVQNTDDVISVSIQRDGEVKTFDVLPVKGLIAAEPEKPALGIASALVGIKKLSFFQAIGAGFSETIQNIGVVAVGLLTLIGSAFSFSADLSNIAGPVGIASLAGNAAAFGLGSVLSFAAIISINLGILNFLPFPALDGGRLAFLGVEAVTRRKIPSGVSNAINLVGFAILIILMVAVTAHDIFRLVS